MALTRESPGTNIFLFTYHSSLLVVSDRLTARRRGELTRPVRPKINSEGSFAVVLRKHGLANEI